jgi:hypothetical protein
MSTEFGQFITSQTSSGVLILSQNLPISDAIDAIILIWEASTNLLMFWEFPIVQSILEQHRLLRERLQPDHDQVAIGAESDSNHRINATFN